MTTERTKFKTRAFRANKFLTDELWRGFRVWALRREMTVEEGIAYLIKEALDKEDDLLGGK